MPKLPSRKSIRLKGYDYSSAGAYFITACVKDKRNILGQIVGRDVLIAPPLNDVPYVKLSQYGEVVEKHINKINLLNDVVLVDKHVVMPNHIHMIIKIAQHESRFCKEGSTSEAQNSGAMRTSRPTSVSVSSIIRSFKTMVTKELGFSLWQPSFHDRIIRDEADYQRIWQYIDENPVNWQNDDYYMA